MRQTLRLCVERISGHERLLNLSRERGTFLSSGVVGRAGGPLWLRAAGVRVSSIRPLVSDLDLLAPALSSGDDLNSENVLEAFYGFAFTPFIVLTADPM